MLYKECIPVSLLEHTDISSYYNTDTSQSFYAKNTFRVPHYAALLTPAFQNPTFLGHLQHIEIETIYSTQELGDYDKLISHRINFLASECKSLKRCVIHIPGVEEVEPAPIVAARIDTVIEPVIDFVDEHLYITLAITGIWILISIFDLVVLARS